MDITCIIFGIMFIISGILFALGKLHTRIKAWQAMSQQERNAIRIEPLCRNIGSMIALCGGIFLIGGLWAAFRSSGFTIAMIVWLVIAGIDVWQIGKSGRYTR